jgi:two-component system, sensor histidine kinase and response regulator
MGILSCRRLLSAPLWRKSGGIMVEHREKREKPTVLVVEDSPEDISVMTEILHGEYHVRIATGGEDAMRIATSDPAPDLILLDIMMPDMDGVEVCRRLKRDDVARTIPVIFVTAKDEVADEAAGFAVGGVDYIAKPVNPHLVRARVKVHLDLKRARDDLERQNEMLVQSARMREEVEAINRHDLKNPLMVIMNVPRALLTGANLTETDRKLLGMVENAGLKILEMINRTIDTYKMEMGTYVLNAAPVDVVAAIEQVAAAFLSLSEAKGLSVDVSVRGRPLSLGDAFHVLGEELLVYSMLANIVKNAIEASPQNGRIDVSLAEGEAATMIVHNDGAIPRDIRGRFFQKFATANKEGGTGLGAYSAWLMVRTMHGAIRFETSEEEGTTVIVTLPRA